MEYEDQLPCGGFPQEDNIIKKAMRKVVQEAQTDRQKEQKSKEDLSAKIEDSILYCESEDCEKQQECCNKQTKCGQKQQKISQKNPEPKKQAVRAIKTCVKCKTQRAVLIQKTQAVCQACLYKNMQYKCRLHIQNSLAVNKDSSMLVCMSGGLNSICLVQIMANIMSKYVRSKLFGRMEVIHVHQQESIRPGYAQIFEKETGVKLTIIELQQAVEGTTIQQVREIISLFGESANSVDLLNIFRDRLILNYARSNNFDYVLKGNNAQSLAAETFKLFTVGLGANIASLQWDAGNAFFFPLRTILQKQLQYYYHKKGLKKLAIKWQDDNIEYNVGKGIDGQLKTFIQGLQQMYSHTAPAIVRTMEKIKGMSSGGKKCAWCEHQATQQGGLCRRCLRVWQGRRKGTKMQQMPSWMRLQLNDV